MPPPPPPRRRLGPPIVWVANTKCCTGVPPMSDLFSVEEVGAPPQSKLYIYYTLVVTTNTICVAATLILHEMPQTWPKVWVRQLLHKKLWGGRGGM